MLSFSPRPHHAKQENLKIRSRSELAKEFARHREVGACQLLLQACSRLVPWPSELEKEQVPSSAGQPLSQLAQGGHPHAACHPLLLFSSVPHAPRSTLFLLLLLSQVHKFPADLSCWRPKVGSLGPQMYSPHTSHRAPNSTQSQELRGHTHRRTHVHTHSGTRSCTHACTHTPAHTCAHTHTYRHTHVHRHISTGTCTHTHQHRRVRTHTHTGTRACTHTHTGTRMCTHTHTGTRACTHTAVVWSPLPAPLAAICCGSLPTLRSAYIL